MPLGNYVILQDGVPERMHFVSHEERSKDITDPRTLRPAVRNVLELVCDRLNGKSADEFGRPIHAIFSAMSENLYNQLQPYLAGSVYKNYEFVITKRGTGDRTRYSVERIPMAAAT